MEHPDAQRSAGSKLFLAYVLLSTLNIAALVLCLVFSNRIETSYRDSVEVDRQSSELEGQVAGLIKAAQLVDPEPNEVFATGDVRLAREHLLRATGTFESLMGETLRAAQGNTSRPQRDLTATLKQASALMDQMKAQLMAVLRDFERGDLDAAKAQTVAADRTFAQVISRLLAFQDQSQRTEKQNHSDYSAITRKIRTQQRLLVLLVGMLIAFSFLYARKLSRKVVGIEVLEKNLVALCESQQRFDQAARATRDVIWEWDLVNGRIWFNEQARELYSVDLAPDGWIDMKKAVGSVHPDDVGRMKNSVVEAFKGTADSWEGAFRVVRPDGTVAHVINRAQFVRDGRGRVVKLFGAVSDMTAREAAQESLRRSEERFQLISRATNDSLFDADLATGRVWVNDTFVREFGVRTVNGTIKLADWSDLIHPEDKERVLSSFRSASDRSAVWKDEYRLRRPDGEYSYVYVRRYPIQGRDGHADRIVGAMVDVTETENAARALRESDERFQLISRATNDVLWDWDLATNQVWVNDAFVKEYVDAPGNMIDLSVWAGLLHPDEVEDVLAGVQEFLAGNDDIWIKDYRIRRRDGSWAETYNRAYKARGADGAPVRMLGAMVDVTARRKIEEALLDANREMMQLTRRTQSILNGAADAIIGTDRDRRITFVNPAAARILGSSPEEMEGHPLTSIINADPFAPKGSTRGAAILEMNFFRDGGVAFPVEYLLSQILDEHEEVSGFVLTFRDVTERQAVEKLKSEFVSVVSHELRTPLTSIRGALGLLEGGMLGEITDRGRRMLEIAVSNTDRLVRLINDILDIERMESGNVMLSARRCEASELVTQAVDIMRPLAEKAGVTIEVGEVTGIVWADPDRILQTLTNLLSNAIKFSLADSKIEVRVAPSSRRKVIFRIKDQGRGIPGDKLGAVFERFHQVDASDSREKGGSGLGLAICRSIVRQHGGDIWVTSESGEGSEFSFSIPAMETGDSTVPLSGSMRAIQRLKASRKILLCDDDPSVREVLQAILESHGFQVMAVASGIELLEKVESFQPHSILLDVLMPYMDGWQTMAALRANPVTADIPIVFVTVSDKARLTQQQGPEAWVQKPLEEGTLLEALQGVLGMAERRPRVVLVEDDIDLARVVIESFEKQGIDTFHAADGKRALELFDDIVPDLVVLDVILPRMDGYSVVARLRERQEFRHIPVVVYSADELTAGERSRLVLGPTEFLTKSRISPAAFERRVIGMLSRITDHQNGRKKSVA